MDTQLGEDLVFQSMGRGEALSAPFHFVVEAVSHRCDIKARDLLGATTTVNLDLGHGNNSVRHWNAQVARLDYVATGDDGYSRYRLAPTPWLSQLGLGTDCPIFQKMSVPDIVAQVFRNAGFNDFERALWHDYSPLGYVVQYRESDLAFISRLLEHQGIYYFVRHEQDKDTLVLADEPAAYDPAQGYEQLRHPGCSAATQASTLPARSTRRRLTR